MQINNTTFQGTFRIKPNEIKAKDEIPALFTQGRQIFSDIIEKGDKVIVLRDNYDKRVGHYIEENNIKGIEYYPQINTKSGLDDEQPEGLIALIKERTQMAFDDLKDILSAITEQKSPKKIKQPKAIKEIKTISNTLRLNIEAPEIKTSKSSTIVRDEAKKRTIEIIKTKRKTSYVYVRPDSLNESSTKCIIDNRGNLVKEFTTPNEICKFKKLFNELKKEEVNTLV